MRRVLHRWWPPLAASLVLAVWAVAPGCGPRAPAPQDQAGEARPARVITHTLAEGETLGQVADNYYGDPARADRVAADNGLAADAALAPGSVLQLRFSADEWTEAQRRAAALGPYNRGVERLAARRLAEAEDAFRLALATAPALTAARYNLALVLVQRGRADEAVELLDALAAERPGDADILFALGHALFTANRPAEAVARFGQALASDPGHQRAAFGLARALEEAGDTPGAIAAWERYLALDDASGWADQARSRLEALRHGG